VHEIHSQGILISNFNDVKAEATRHFSDLFKEQPIGDASDLLNFIPKAINNIQNEDLNQIVTLEEIKQAIDGMEDDRAPGPDGYNATFIKLCWDIIKIDLFKMVSSSQRRSKIGGSTNSAFLALIPKEKEAKTFDRFRPISLCNIGYKIITKIIASRLKTYTAENHPGESRRVFQRQEDLGKYYINSRGYSLESEEW